MYAFSGMINILKIISTLIVFLVVSFFIKTLFSIITGLESWISSALSLCLATLVSWYLWKWLSGQNIGISTAVLSGSLILGGFGFIFGFFGPMLIAQDTQQAATTGILIASPLGMLTGAVAGYMLATRQKD